MAQKAKSPSDPATSDSHLITDLLGIAANVAEVPKADIGCVYSITSSAVPKAIFDDFVSRYRQRSAPLTSSVAALGSLIAI
jgi:hypothetical protein